jgi:hypothetical protein
MILFRGTVKIHLCSTIHPKCTKLTTAEGERKPSYLTSKDYYPETYHSSKESSNGSSLSLTSASLSLLMLERNAVL